jgi:hypothetical protein
MLHGLPWLEQPVTVVDDGDACLAVTLEPGSRFTFFAHPFGAHPWAAYEVWSGSTVLQLQREGDAYGVWKFFDLEQQFTHWYINFQAPLVRRVDPTPTRWSRTGGSRQLNARGSPRRPTG